MTLREALFVQCYGAYLQSRKQETVSDGYDKYTQWTGSFVRPSDGKFDHEMAYAFASNYEKHYKQHDRADPPGSGLYTGEGDTPLCTLFTAKIPKVGSPSAG
jgi:hypothetical protein